MPEAAAAGKTDAGAFHYQEIVFSILMGTVAILSRENPNVVYPQLLWAFLALFAFNLAAHFLLRRSGGLRMGGGLDLAGGVEVRIHLPRAGVA